MKKFVYIMAALAVLPAAGSVLAAGSTDPATATCEKLAKKHHIASDKMEVYMQSCVAKHQKTHATEAAPTTNSPTQPTAGK